MYRDFFDEKCINMFGLMFQRQECINMYRVMFLMNSA